MLYTDMNLSELKEAKRNLSESIANTEESIKTSEGIRKTALMAKWRMLVHKKSSVESEIAIRIAADRFKDTE